MNKLRTFMLVAAAIAALTAGGCVRSYKYTDYESYVRPGVVPSSYKRAAVLYVGYSAASSLLQEDASASKSKQDSGKNLGSQHFAADVVLYSNALVNALAKRDVTLIERNKVNDLIREQGLIQQELLDISDVEKIQRLGRLLKVDLLIRGSVVADNGGWFVTESILQSQRKLVYVALRGLSVTGIDTRTGQVVWVDTMYIARRIAARQIKNKAELTTTNAVFEIVDEMVDRFMSGGAK